MPRESGGHADLPRVAACVMVRNEEQTLPRLIASLRPIVDYWVVVDTGSTDRTLEVVRSAFGDIPGELHERPWVDFGHNRTELLELARGKARWLLLLDADYQVDGTIDVDALTDADAYLLQHTGSAAYRTVRLVRGDRAWRYLGVVHEYLDSADGSPYRRAQLDSISFTDFRDGGFRHTDRTATLERDRALLADEVQRHPDDARSWFYLARTYQELGRAEEALQAFRTRVTLGGWGEEVYYAQFQVGHLLAGAGQKEAALGAWLQAWELRPQRLEAVHAAVRMLRIDGRYRAGLALANAVADSPLPADILFVHTDIWHFELPLERSICDYYVTGPRACLAQSNALLKRPDLPAEVRKFAVTNAQLCHRELAGASR